MADINALIAQGGTPVQVENPINQMAKLYALKGAQQEYGMNEQKIAEQNALRAYLSGNPDLSTPEGYNKLTTGFGASGLAYGKQLQEISKGKTEEKAKQWKMIEDKTGYYRDLLSGVNTPDDARVWTAAVYSDPDVGPVMARMGGNLEQAVARVPTDPAGFQAWKQQAAVGAAKFVELNKPHFIDQDLGGTKRTLTVPGMGGEATVVPGTAATKTMLPGEAARIGLEQRRVALAEKEAKEKGAGLSPEESAVVSKAILEGRLDPNKVNSRNVKIIASTLMTQPDADLRGLSLEATTETASARTLGNISANVVTAANEAEKMIPIAQSYISKIAPSDYPVLNKAGLFVAKQTGDPNQAGLAASLNALVNTYARAINPRGVPTVSDKNHAREVITTAMSQGQFAEVFNVMQQEMAASQAAPKEARPKLFGGESKEKEKAPASAGAAVMYAKNPKTGERIMSNDGGNTWTPAR